MPTDVTDKSRADVSITRWAPGPRRPRLGPDAVDVWRVELADIPEDLVELLSASEHARAERMARPRDRAFWPRSRAVLRVLLGRYLGTDPRELHIAPDQRGKPVLDAETAGHRRASGADRLCFNLSHSNETALYAFSTAGPVGIDVEVVRRQVDIVALASRAFSPAEARRLQQLDPATREQEFLRSWVRHEAVLKCIGTGIWGDRVAAGHDGPWTAELDLGAFGHGAVAVSRPPNELRCWDWPI